jgi:hypothetical protein
MPKAETFQAFMKRERTRLQKARDKAAQKKAEVVQELKELKRELTAIDAGDRRLPARNQMGIGRMVFVNWLTRRLSRLTFALTSLPKSIRFRRLRRR